MNFSRQLSASTSSHLSSSKVKGSSTALLILKWCSSFPISSWQWFVTPRVWYQRQWKHKQHLQHQVTLALSSEDQYLPCRINPEWGTLLAAPITTFTLHQGRRWGFSLVEDLPISRRIATQRSTVLWKKISLYEDLIKAVFILGEVLHNCCIK